MLVCIFQLAYLQGLQACFDAHTNAKLGGMAMRLVWPMRNVRELRHHGLEVVLLCESRWATILFQFLYMQVSLINLLGLGLGNA